MYLSDDLQFSMEALVPSHLVAGIIDNHNVQNS